MKRLLLPHLQQRQLCLFGWLPRINKIMSTQPAPLIVIATSPLYHRRQPYWSCSGSTETVHCHLHPTTSPPRPRPRPPHFFLYRVHMRTQTPSLEQQETPHPNNGNHPDQHNPDCEDASGPMVQDNDFDHDNINPDIDSLSLHRDDTSTYVCASIERWHGGKNGLTPERAEQLVQAVIDNQPSLVDIDMINGLLGAWVDFFTGSSSSSGGSSGGGGGGSSSGGSSSESPPDKTSEHVYHIYRWVYDDPRLSPLRIRPNVTTYSKVLQCLVAAAAVPVSSGSNRHVLPDRDIHQKIEAVLQEIVHRYVTGNDVVDDTPPNIDFYNQVIHAYLFVLRDFIRAESVLHQMEQLLPKSIPHSPFGHDDDNTTVCNPQVIPKPNLRTYVEFLNCYSKLRSVESAEQTERMHNRMREVATATSDPSLHPTAYTYEMVLKGWAASNAEDTTQRMWLIYKQMTRIDNVELHLFNYTTLLGHLSKSNTLADANRALCLLQIMESYNNDKEHNVKIKPNGRHYSMVLQGCMKAGSVGNAVRVIHALLDAYQDEPQETDGSKPIHKALPYHKACAWIIETWIWKWDLESATLFLMDVTNKTEYKDHLSGIVPHFGPVHHLRKIWLISSHPQKDHYVNEIETRILPNVVRALDVQKNMKKKKSTKVSI
jgi:hypothetical protein